MLYDCQRLTPAEFEDAIERHRSGDLSAREALIKHHVGLVIYHASKYNDDQITSEALLVLVKAVDDFKEGHLTAFVTMRVRYGCLSAVAKNKIIPIDKCTLYQAKKNKRSIETPVECLIDDRQLRSVTYQPPCSLETRELLELVCRTDEDRLILFSSFYQYTLSEIGFMINRSTSYVQKRRDLLYLRFRGIWNAIEHTT